MKQELDLTQIVAPLLAWYDREARVLPWRDNPQPYRVWVSEIMLQQTRVEAVKPYFERFLQALPTVADLAAAPEDTLLKLWEGLGYYNRVRNLQKAAQRMVSEYGGQVPSQYEQLLALPGFCEYTAGAVASIAYAQPVPAVDGNVLRVIARLTADACNVLDVKVKKQITEAVRQVIPQTRAGDFNQALMELGATVCLPNGAPLCGRCPLAHLCLGHRQGVADSLPVKQKKKPRVVEERTVFLIACKGKAALRRRPAKGLLAGLWELPSVTGALSWEEACRQLREWGLDADRVHTLHDAKHIFTHREWHMTAFSVRVHEPAKDFVWASEQELNEQYTLPSAFKAYINFLKDLISVDI